MSAHELALLLAVAGGAGVRGARDRAGRARAAACRRRSRSCSAGSRSGELWDGSHAAARPGVIADLRHGRARDRAAAGRLRVRPRAPCGDQLAPVLALGIAGTAATFAPRRAGSARLHAARLDAVAAARRGALADRPGRRVRGRLARGRGRLAHRAPARGRGRLQRPGGDRAHASRSWPRRRSGSIEASSIVWTTVRELVRRQRGRPGRRGCSAARVLGPRRPTLAMAPPLAVLAGAFATFGLGSLAHGSGFVAVYLYGLVLGDDADLADSRRRARVRRAARLARRDRDVRAARRGAARRCRSRGRSSRPPLLTLALVFVIRPALVYPVLRAFRRTHAEAVFATAGGLKGAVPILLAALPLQAGLDGSRRIFALAGLVVLASLALQGPLVARLAPASPRRRPRRPRAALRCGARGGRASRGRRAR